MPGQHTISESSVIEADGLTLLDESRNLPISGGNKARKLQRILDGSRVKGLLTFGSLYSSHCVAVAHWAAARDLPSRLIFIQDEKMRPFSPAAQIAERLGASVRFVERGTAEQEISRERAEWKEFRWIQGGAHEFEGALAYRDWFHETLARSPGLHRRAWIALPFGTGTTALGIAMGIREAGLKMRVLGISVSRSESDCYASLSKFDCSEAVDSIQIIDSFSGTYGARTGGEVRATSLMLKTFGIAPDPVYNVRVAQVIFQERLTNGAILNTGGLHNLSLP